MGLFLVFFMMGIVNSHFPAKYDQFMNDSLPNKDPFSFSCKRWTCKYFHEMEMNTSWKRNIGYYDQMGCACDEMCPFFKDCCEDYVPKRNSKLLNRFDHLGLKVEYFSCLKINPIAFMDHIHVIDKCPFRNGENISNLRKNCSLNNLSEGNDLEFSYLSLPVTGQRSHALYRNMYCALCHDEPYITWSPEITCSRKENAFNERNNTIIDVLKKPWCDLHFRPPPKISDSKLKHYRVCYPDVKGSCRHPELVPKEVEKECRAGNILRMVHRHYFSFQNPFCAMCFVGNMSFVQCAKPSGIPIRWESSGPYPFSILFDLNKGTVKTQEDHSVTMQKTIPRCDHGMFFDPFSYTCREILCPIGMVYSKDKCIVNKTGETVNSTLQIFEDSCPQVELNRTEFKFNGTHVHLLKQNTFFQPTFINKTKNGIRVCSEEAGINIQTTTEHTSRTVVINFTPMESIVSACGMSVSILALSLNAVCLLKIKTMRKTPNKYILSMTISLLLANSFLLSGSFVSRYFVLCKVMSILSHYFFLVVFMWMNVMAVDMWIAFSRLKNSLDNSPNRFTHYSIYAWLLPLLIVVIALSLDSVHPISDISPGYGSGLCWISSEFSLTIFFAAPLALILVSNLALFLLTTRNLYLTQKASQGSDNLSSSRHGKKGTFLVYVKLTVIVGLTWILGFIMLIWDSPVITYTFIVVNSLHGLSVFATCLYTRDFKRQITSSCISIRSVLTSQGSNNSSTETKTSTSRYSSSGDKINIKM